MCAGAAAACKIRPGDFSCNAAGINCSRKVFMKYPLILSARRGWTRQGRKTQRAPCGPQCRGFGFWPLRFSRPPAGPGHEPEIDTERQNLLRIEAEYGKYKETKMVINKADIELLTGSSRPHLLDEKTGVHGLHLPDNYWITKFGFDQKTFSVVGFG